MQGRTLGGSDWEWTGTRVGARLEEKSKQRSEIKGSEACGFFSVCVSGPVAQHWSRLAPTGMQLPSDPHAALLSHKEVAARKREGGGERE